MTIIPLAPFTTSMLITILNATIEILCVSSIFILIAIHECNRLLRGEHISIRRHMYVVRIVAVMAMVIFVVLEVVISIYSGSAFRSRMASQPCISTGDFLPPGDKGTQGEAVTFRCLKIDGTVFTFRHGNYSLDTGQVQCEDNIIYRYKTGTKEELAVEGGTVGCDEEFCVVVHLQNDTNRVAFSEPIDVRFFLPDEVIVTGTSRIFRFLVTEFFFNVTTPAITIAERAAKAYKQNVTDGLQLRRRTFQGTTEDKCDFVVKKDEVTEISIWIVVLMCIVWTMSLILFAVTMSQRKHVFYDVRSTWDWAKKTNHLVDGTRDGDLFLRCVREDGVPRIYVVDGVDEDNFERQVSNHKEAILD